MSYLDFIPLKFDRVFTFVHKVSFSPVLSINFDHVVTLVQNSTYCFFLGWKITSVTLIFSHVSYTYHFPMQETNDELDFGLKWQWDQTLWMGLTKKKIYMPKWKYDQFKGQSVNNYDTTVGNFITSARSINKREKEQKSEGMPQRIFVMQWLCYILGVVLSSLITLMDCLDFLSASFLYFIFWDFGLCYKALLTCLV